MPETFTQVCTFCGLVGHYRCFIKGFTHIVRPLYNMLDKEVKIGPVQLPPKGTGGSKNFEGQDSVSTNAGIF